MKTILFLAPLILTLSTLPSQAQEQKPSPGKVEIIRILAGSPTPVTDRRGITWEAARGFSGGETVTRILPELPEIYQSERYGDFSFSEPLQNGKYRITLHFCESYHKSWVEARGKRSFNVQIENTITNIKDLSIAAEGFRKPLVKLFEVTVRDGKLDISFKATPKNPADYDPGCLNAIEIEWLSKQTGLRQPGAKMDQVELYKD